MPIHFVPIGDFRSIGVVRDRTRNDVETLGQQRQVYRRISVDEICSKNPGSSRRLGFGRDDRGIALDVGESKVVAVVTIREFRSPAGNETPFRRGIAINALRAVEGIARELASGKCGWNTTAGLEALLDEV